jgi:hydroxymethylglutaryl-CoA synthase
MTIGIDKLQLYTPRFATDALALAEARGRERETVAAQLMLQTRAVAPPCEDAVTLSVNAARRLLAPEDLAEVELLVVGTESGVDLSKPISTWVHRYCGLGPGCLNLEVKHACFGATAALKLAMAWLMARESGKKALVVSADLSLPYSDHGQDFAGGAVAVAMLVSHEPRILALDLARSGQWTSEIADTFRPNALVELADGEASLYSYLDALEGSFDAYVAGVGEVDYDASFRKHVYHAPFPGMTVQAHRAMCRRFGAASPEEIRASFEHKVAGGLRYATQLGTAYGASTFVSLLGLLGEDDLRSGDRVSVFAYGSGCQAEFYEGAVAEGACPAVRALDLDGHLVDRYALTLAEYEAVEAQRRQAVGQRDYRPRHGFALRGRDPYAGQGLLVLSAVEDFRRRYEWS